MDWTHTGAKPDHSGTQAALVEIRRESLDLYNRLHSIDEDIKFVAALCQNYARLPTVPNLRCGAWYVNPSIAASEPAYFKSTDGHFNNWSFNLRRPNIHLLTLLSKNNGMIIVDSTRAGKRIPDALSKTVPLWCAVINRVVKVLFDKGDAWDTALYTPPAVVSLQEHSQIEGRLDQWAAQLCASTYTLPDLRYPLRPIWMTPANTSWPSLDQPGLASCCPVICVSASKQIHEGVERRSQGFSYVQGSGDDHELWGQGLTPSIFWRHKDRLLRTDRCDLEALVHDLVSQATTDMRQEQWRNVPSKIAQTCGRLMIGALSDLPARLPTTLPGYQDSLAYVILSDTIDQAVLDSEPAKQKNVLSIQLAQGKKGQATFLETVLPEALPFIDARLSEGKAICICCDTGKDTSVGLALAASQLMFDNEGKYVDHQDRNTLAPPDKASISARLQWIITSRPQANPSRATLKRVNEFLMTPVSLRRRTG